MASSLEYVQHVAAQLSGAGAISYKKLFGEYGLWCGGKFFGTVENNQFWCGGTFFGMVENNQFYIKVTEAGHKHLPEAEPVAPHGGRPGMYLVEELDDRESLTALVLDTCGQLPEPHKPKQSVSKPSQPKSGKRKS